MGYDEQRPDVGGMDHRGAGRSEIYRGSREPGIMSIIRASIVTRETARGVIARCPELDIHALGGSESEARRRLKAVVSFYINEAFSRGADVAIIFLDGELVRFTGFPEGGGTIQ